MNETVWQRAKQDLKLAMGSLRFWLLDAVGGAVFGAVTQPFWGFVCAILILVATWLYVLFRVPIRQRDDARNLVRERDAKIIALEKVAPNFECQIRMAAFAGEPEIQHLAVWLTVRNTGSQGSSIPKTAVRVGIGDEQRSLEQMAYADGISIPNTDDGQFYGLDEALFEKGADPIAPGSHVNGYLATKISQETFDWLMASEDCYVVVAIFDINDRMSVCSRPLKSGEARTKPVHIPGMQIKRRELSNLNGNIAGEDYRMKQMRMLMLV